MKSGRGGSREGAGRKTTWVSGCKQEDTKPIRVPKVIAERLLEVAHKLDAGEVIELDTQSKRKKIVKSTLESKLTAVEECLTKWRQYSNECSSNPSTRMQKLRQMLVELELIVWGKDLSPILEAFELVTESKKISKDKTIELDTKSNELVGQEYNSDERVISELLGELELSGSVSQLELLDPPKKENLEANKLLLLAPTGCKPEPHSAGELAKRLETDVSNISKYKAGKRKGTLLEWSLERDPDGFGWEYSEELKKYLPVKVSDSVTE